MKRRDFIKNSAIISAGATGLSSLYANQTIITDKGPIKSTVMGTSIFKPFLVQKGIGPHLYDLVWATDENWDTFYSNIALNKEGIVISDLYGKKGFGINARWNVEGFGYTNITADNDGKFYQLPAKGKIEEFNLNYEFASSRVSRNVRRLKGLSASGWPPSAEVNGLHELAYDLLQKAKQKARMSDSCASLAQQSLHYALWGSEKMELDYAEYVIKKNPKRTDFDIGCDARAFYQMDQDIFLENFTPLFSYANITFVPKANTAIARDFEPERGKHNYAIRDHLVDTLAEYGIKSQGRLLYWFHSCCVPEWMKKYSFNDLRNYVEDNTAEVIGHFGDRMYAWEMVNELHDWANEFELSNEQTIELTKVITDVAKSVAPNVKRTINNCCPFAEYVQMHKYSGGQTAKYPQRTPVQFTKDILDAGIDIDIVEQQMYYPYRDLQDTILLIERYEQFNKPMHISEIGCPGGPTVESVKLDTYEFPKEPYVWHHHWDEETQADWLEQFYTLAYSKSYIKAANWFDFVEPFSYMKNGGILKSIKGDKKSSYHRFEKIVKRFRA